MIWRTTTLGAGLALTLALFVSSAQAANLVQNPGFEADCSGIPCNWAVGTYNGATGTISRDTTIKLSGSASLETTGTFNADAVSDCFTVTHGTTYNFGVWYRTTDDATGVVIAVTDYPSTSGPCTGTAHVEYASTAGNTNGGWKLLNAETTTTILGTSARVDLYWDCSICSSRDVHWDDVTVQTEPLAVTVASFAARPSAKGVLLRWRTASETNVLGFNVFRTGRKVNRQLIRARGSVSGWRYSFLDRHAPYAALTYKLQAVGTDGSRSWFGPVRVGGLSGPR